MKTGSISLIQQTTSSQLVASFSETSTSNPNATCTNSTVGPCTVVTCTIGSGMAGTPTYDSAGTVTVTGSRIDGGIAVMPMATPVLYSASWNRPAFATGDVLTFAASGATVPAFSNQTVTAPSAITLTAPTAPYTILRSTPLIVSWTGGTTGQVQVTVGTFTQSPASTASVQCQGPASAGSLTIPTAALASLPAVSSSAFFSALVTNSSSFNAGPYAVTVAIQNYAAGLEPATVR